MTWYPSVDTVIRANKRALAEGGDRHPHKLIRSRQAIQTVIDETRMMGRAGLIGQAAHLMLKLVLLHAFAGGNHRTAYLVVKMFLRNNGKRLEIESYEDAYSFITHLENKTLEEIQEWIGHGTESPP